MSDLKSLRIEKKMTQQQVADLVGISLRSYKTYENESGKADTMVKADLCRGQVEGLQHPYCHLPSSLHCLHRRHHEGRL